MNEFDTNSFYQPPVEIFPQRLRAARELRGWSQRGLGRRAGVPATSIAHFEIRTRKPSFDTLRRLAQTLQVTADFLLGIADAPDAHAGDPLFQDLSKLSDTDRDLAQKFLRTLIEHCRTRDIKDEE